MSAEPITARRTLWGLLFVVAFAGGYAAWVLGATPEHQPGIDSHYHFRMGGEIAGGTLVPDMAADLPLTVYRDMNVDHYWGFHVLLAPFAALDDGLAGMKVATIALFSLVFVALFLFLFAFRVPYAWAWASLPLLLTTLDWRYMMLRGGQLMVPLTLATAAVAVLVRRDWVRRLVLLALGAVGMLSYQGAVVLPGFHIAALVGVALLAPGRARRSWWPDPLFTTAGLALGLTIHPAMDGSFAPWRFAAYHLFTMGVDRDGLYPRVAEFHAFPPDMLWQHPEWGLLLLAMLVGLGWVLRRRLRGEELPFAVATTAGLAAAGLVLGAKALRATEYAVPMLVAFLATLPPALRTPARRWAVGAGFALVLLGGAWLHGGPLSDFLGSRGTLNTRLYEGAAPVLAQHAEAPVLNIAEADYNLLLWEYPPVSCVQGLSRYFLRPNRAVYDDVQLLRDAAVPAAEQLAALGRFVDRGVRLVATQTHKIDGSVTPFAQLALAHPELLRPVFLSNLPPGERRAALLAIDVEGLRARLDEGGT